MENFVLFLFLFVLCPLVIPMAIAVIGVLFGHLNEKSHLRSLEDREDLYRDFMVTQIKSFPGFQPGPQPPNIVMAEVVIASDYWKTFLAGWINFFGGEMKGFQMMFDRARREAILRLIEQADEQGFNAICNVRLDSADISGAGVAARGRAAAIACVMASATAYRVK